MKERELKGHISALEKMLQEFKQAKKRGKETNENKERAQAIAEIEETTKNLETYVRINKNLLKLIAGTEDELKGEIGWNDIVRPKHFEEDLQEEIRKLIKKVS